MSERDVSAYLRVVATTDARIGYARLDLTETSIREILGMRDQARQAGECFPAFEAMILRTGNLTFFKSSDAPIGQDGIRSEPPVALRERWAFAVRDPAQELGLDSRDTRIHVAPGHLACEAVVCCEGRWHTVRTDALPLARLIVALLYVAPGDRLGSVLAELGHEMDEAALVEAVQGGFRAAGEPQGPQPRARVPADSLSRLLHSRDPHIRQEAILAISSCTVPSPTQRPSIRTRPGATT